ncbi:hypothetical protein KUL42_23260 [Alteromonas sp. KUL42]|uniref:DUF3016 domain-containing protein n=1 Tax=Alteromonas sp. KUL42 TaxID=2480797 RepID=UPI001036A317|nr:DUF3016 domain-containing protein [Alteromonas sp. KUL42]TAP34811.1 DUF3016 domain-containing protein [Alteromonas sp. KUL42]GEA07565.1 hypothetical protein KUL42_23260 [Alteromonas sp. KUL42]
MNKLLTVTSFGCAAMVGLVVFGNSPHAAEVKLVWEEPESYTDVRPSNESRKRFRDRTLEELEAYITELAASLPESQVLSMTVTNVDLAGEVWPSQFVGFGSAGASDVRIIKRIDIPRMSFSYTLSSEDGQVLLSEQEVKLKDMDFMESNIRRHRTDSLSYEKAMLDDWFADTFPKQVAVNNTEH